MELSQLRYFYVVAQHEHITKAAEILNVAQPALTQSIHRLEDELGVELFNRVGRRIELNNYGKYLMSRIEPLLAAVDSVKGELQQMRDRETKIIRISVQYASAVVAKAISDYQKIYSDVVFKISQTDDNSCDISIKPYDRSIDIDSNTDERVFKQRIMLAVPKDSVYADKKSISLMDVENENFGSLESSMAFRKRCDALCAACGFKPRIVFECENPVMEMHLVGMGLCVAFYAEFSWSEPKHTDIKLIPISNPGWFANVAVMKHVMPFKNKEVEMFYDFLLGYFKENEKLYSDYYTSDM